MSEQARHRSPERPATIFSDAGEAVTGRLAVISRSSAVLAASTGMIAGGGLPTPAHGVPAQSSIANSASPASPPTSAALTAPMVATVTFASSAFVAQVAPARHAASPRTRAEARTAHATARAATARHTAARRAAPRRAAPPKPEPARARSTKAEPSKPEPSKPVPTKAEPTKARAKAAQPKTALAKTAPTKAAPTKAAPTKAAPDTTAPTKRAPAKKHRPAAPPARPRAKPPADTSTRGSAVLAVAARYVGTPYRYGGTSPRGFDCSGYTGYVYRQLGKSLPRTANQQMLATRRVSRSQARAGDLVFFVSGNRAYHVGLYAGGGKMYDAPRTGKTIQKRAIWDAAVVFGRVTS